MVHQDGSQTRSQMVRKEAQRTLLELRAERLQRRKRNVKNVERSVKGTDFESQESSKAGLPDQIAQSARSNLEYDETCDNPDNLDIAGSAEAAAQSSGPNPTNDALFQHLAHDDNNGWKENLEDSSDQQVVMSNDPENEEHQTPIGDYPREQESDCEVTSGEHVVPDDEQHTTNDQSSEADDDFKEVTVETSELLRIPCAGPGLVWMLNKAGIHNIDDLAASDADALSSELGLVGELLDVSAWISWAQELSEHVPAASA